MSQLPYSASGSILVAGAPKAFDLGASFRTASDIWIASAFAHKSGWEMLRDDLLQSSGKVTLISGLFFCQTEPVVLRDWIGKEFTRKGVRPYLYIGQETFHPKVFVVQGRRTSFALVGSGNLSKGGLRDNVECFVYVSEDAILRQIVSWLSEMTADRNRCVPLSIDTIKVYEPRWRRAGRSRRELRKQTVEATRKITTICQAKMKKWKQAVSEAKTFFRSSKFHRWHSNKRVEARKVLGLLHHPRYDFTRQEWSDFYDIWEMGHLIPIYKNRVYRQTSRLRKGLRMIAQSKLDIARRVDAVLNHGSPEHVNFLGINAVSKILASIDPKRCPVWNNPVKRSVLAFGYKAPRGATPGERYAAFAKLMLNFVRDTGASDMLALDSFFFWKDRASNE